jgi:hypothetical protein
MERCGSFAYTRQVLEELKQQVMEEVAKLGGHQQLEALLDYLHNQVKKTSKGLPTPPSPPLNPQAASLPSTGTLDQPDNFPRVDSI